MTVTPSLDPTMRDKIRVALASMFPGEPLPFRDLMADALQYDALSRGLPSLWVLTWLGDLPRPRELSTREFRRWCERYKVRAAREVNNVAAG